MKKIKIVLPYDPTIPFLCRIKKKIVPLEQGFSSSSLWHFRPDSSWRWGIVLGVREHLAAPQPLPIGSEEQLPPHSYDNQKCVQKLSHVLVENHCLRRIPTSLALWHPRSQWWRSNAILGGHFLRSAAWPIRRMSVPPYFGLAQPKLVRTSKVHVGFSVYLVKTKWKENRTPCWFPRAAVTNYHKVHGLEQQKLILPQFWRRDVQNQGVGRAALPPKEAFLAFSCFWWLQASHGLPLCVSFLCVSYKDTCQWT